MWLPRDVDEIDAAVTDGQLEETHTFDGKALPGRNKDIAIDICAMTVDGGSLLYGVSEDEHQRLTVRTPFPLAGERERIDQIVQTSIVEVPVITIREYPLSEGEADGYLVVAVPQSARAPHQVVVGSDMRFYGRGATGNRILGEREVSDLYARRQRWEIDRDAHLSDVVSAAPWTLPEGNAYMHAFARPVAFDDGYLRAQLERDEMELRNALVAATNVIDETVAGYLPDLSQARFWRLHGGEGIVIADSMDNIRRAIRMTIGHDGETRLFACVGARYQTAPEMSPVGIFETMTAGNLASYLSATGAFFSLAAYVGSVDVGVAVTGIAGAVPDHLYRPSGSTDVRYPTDSYRATDRIVAPELANRPREIALDLLRRFHDALGGIGYQPRI
jgi:hypothetical protein